MRKANLANCQFLTNLTRPDATFAVFEQHRNCVRSVAVESLVKTKFVKEEVILLLHSESSDGVLFQVNNFRQQERWWMRFLINVMQTLNQ